MELPVSDGKMFDFPMLSKNPVPTGLRHLYCSRFRCQTKIDLIAIFSLYCG